MHTVGKGGFSFHLIQWLHAGAVYLPRIDPERPVLAVSGGGHHPVWSDGCYGDLENPGSGAEDAGGGRQTIRRDGPCLHFEPTLCRLIKA